MFSGDDKGRGKLKFLIEKGLERFQTDGGIFMTGTQIENPMKSSPIWKYQRTKVAVLADDHLFLLEGPYQNFFIRQAK